MKNSSTHMTLGDIQIQVSLLNIEISFNASFFSDQIMLCNINDHNLPVHKGNLDVFTV